MISTETLESLLKKAQDATQGEWFFTKNWWLPEFNEYSDRNIIADFSYHNRAALMSTEKHTDKVASEMNNGNFMAAANPETIKQLVQCILEMKEALEGYKETRTIHIPDGIGSIEIEHSEAKAVLDKWFGTETKEKV